MDKRVIMGPWDIRRTLARIAHEIIERHKTIGELALVGICTRGVPLAARIAANIAGFEGVKIPVGELDISQYRDDLSSLYLPPVGYRTSVPLSIEGKSVVLVDDVLYTGRSTRAAMDALIDLGRPSSVQLVVLVDRGHREMPIKADYVGQNIPSSRREEVKVRLVETDGVDEVVVVTKASSQFNAGELRERK